MALARRRAWREIRTARERAARRFMQSSGNRHVINTPYEDEENNGGARVMINETGTLPGGHQRRRFMEFVGGAVFCVASTFVIGLTMLISRILAQLAAAS